MSRPLRFVGSIGIPGLLGLLGPGLGGCSDPAPGDGAPPAAGAPAEAEVDRVLAAAEEYLTAGELDEAEAIAVRLVERLPDEPKGRELYGRVLLSRALHGSAPGSPERRDRLERASAEYEAAVRLSPSAGLHQSAGSLAMLAGDRERALGHFLDAGRLDPVNAQHPLYAAQVLIDQARYDDAERQLERALVIDPDEPLAHASLALVALGRERWADAQRHIATARRIAPDDLDLRVQEARVHRRAGDPGRALELLASLPVPERASAAVSAELAAAHTARGEHARAASAWELRYRAQGADPDRWRTALLAAEAWREAGDPARAATWLDEAKLLAPADAPELLEAARSGNG